MNLTEILSMTGLYVKAFWIDQQSPAGEEYGFSTPCFWHQTVVVATMIGWPLKKGHLMSHLHSAPSWCGAQWPVYICTGFQREPFWWNSANCQSKHWCLGTMFIKMSSCLSIAGHSMEWVGCFPLCCFAELEVGPRSLFVLGKHSTAEPHPCLHCLVCY